MDDQADGLAGPRRRLAATAIWIAMAITVLDTAILNVGLPYMAHALAISPSDSLWVIHGYQLAIVASLLIFAALGDALGYRRIYLSGLVVFTLASLGCALAESWLSLVAWRVIQGIGASAIMSVNGALVRHTFPAAHLGRAMGINALVIALSALAAPPIGGLVMSITSWPWLFGINLLFGVLAFVLGWHNLPDARGGPTLIDAFAAILSILAALSLLGGTMGGVESGNLALILGSFVIFVGTFSALWHRSVKSITPLLPVDLMTNPILAKAYIGSICNFSAQSMILSALPFYLRHTQAYQPWLIGLTVGAIPLGLGLISPWAGRWSDTVSNRRLQGGGLNLAALGLAGYALVPVSEPFAMGLCGLMTGAGFGLFQVPNNRRMMITPMRQRGGAAAGMLALSRLSGQITGVVMAGLVLRLLTPTNGYFGFVAAAMALLGGMIARSMDFQSPGIAHSQNRD